MIFYFEFEEIATDQVVEAVSKEIHSSCSCRWRSSDRCLLVGHSRCAEVEVKKVTRDGIEAGNDGGLRSCCFGRQLHLLLFLAPKIRNFIDMGPQTSAPSMLTLAAEVPSS